MAAIPSDSPTASRDDAVPGGRQRGMWIFIRDLSFASVVIAACTTFVVASIWLLFNGHAWLVVSYTVLASAIAPLLITDRPFAQRITLSCSVPFVFLGGTAGFFVYFQLFTFSWLEAVFNNKAGGPLGLVVFVCAFAMAAGAVSAWSFSRLFRRVGCGE